MKKIVIFIFGIILCICWLSKDKNVLIPERAIRIRVIANSNELKDQETKAIIKNEVNNILYNKLKGIDSYSNAKTIIKSNLNEIDDVVSKYIDNYKITFGKNYFPEKEYKGVKYDAGDYESLVIKLGEGEGRNFWCVLFPPLCMIDESKLNNVSYKFFVNELLKKIR